MVALRVKLSEDAGQKVEEVVALISEQMVNTEQIERRFEERATLQMEQQILAEGYVWMPNERLTIRPVHDLEEQPTGKPMEAAGRRAWVWLDILIGG